MIGSRKESFRRLYEIAVAQQGFFTAKQATAAGIARNLHSYHVRTGNWVREHRGIYRLALWPPPEPPNLVLWDLWSRDRDGQGGGVYSHQTALNLHGIQGPSPAKVHMTVPVRFRRSSETPDVLALHYADVPERDIAVGDGYRFTSPMRTILDLAAADKIPRSILRDALLDFLDRGLITGEDVQRVKLPVGARAIFKKLLGGMGTARGGLPQRRRRPSRRR